MEVGIANLDRLRWGMMAYFQPLRRVPRIALSMADFARLFGAVTHVWPSEFRANLLKKK
jgi:hypothetical protein